MRSFSSVDICVRREIQDVMNVLLHKVVHQKENIKKSLNKLLSEIKGNPEENMIETLVTRCMSKAIYTSKNIGHYGLGFQYYTHFTSPIRRYADCIAHRELTEKLDEFATYNDSLEEVFENKEQIEVSKFYEKLPKPHALAVQEWEEGKIYYRDSK